jgi:hypothetical protein
MSQAPLRIVKTQTIRNFNGTTQIQGSPYFERLVKLIPSEIVSIYIFGVGLIPADEKIGRWVWPFVCLVMLIVVRASATKSGKSLSSAQWPAVFISVVSYFIWLYTLGGIFATLPFYKAYLGSLAVLVWTFFVPYIYKGS